MVFLKKKTFSLIIFMYVCIYVKYGFEENYGKS